RHLGAAAPPGDRDPHGARREASDIVRLETARGARVAAIGIAAGLGTALAASRLVAGLLFGVRPADPLTFAAVAAVLGALTVAIAYPPARQAARVDPIQALRSE